MKKILLILTLTIMITLANAFADFRAANYEIKLGENLLNTPFVFDYIDENITKTNYCQFRFADFEIENITKENFWVLSQTSENDYEYVDYSYYYESDNFFLMNETNSDWISPRIIIYQNNGSGSILTSNPEINKIQVYQSNVDEFYEISLVFTNQPRQTLEMPKSLSVSADADFHAEENYFNYNIIGEAWSFNLYEDVKQNQQIQLALDNFYSNLDKSNFEIISNFQKTDFELEIKNNTYTIINNSDIDWVTPDISIKINDKGKGFISGKDRNNSTFSLITPQDSYDFQFYFIEEEAKETAPSSSSSPPKRKIDDPGNWEVIEGYDEEAVEVTTDEQPVSKPILTERDTKEDEDRAPNNNSSKNKNKNKIPKTNLFKQKISLKREQMRTMPQKEQIENFKNKLRKFR